MPKFLYQCLGKLKEPFSPLKAYYYLEFPSGFIAFFKLMGYFVPLNVKEAKSLAESGAAAGQPVDQDVLAFMYALGVGYEANQAKAILNWSFGALGKDLDKLLINM